MKRSLFVLCLLLPLATFAAEKNAKKTPRKPSTLPPKSKMIVVPPPADPAGESAGAGKLITTEMSGRDLEFFTTVVAAGRFQAYLVELLKTRAESDQIKAVGAALSSTQEEENKQVARLAALKGWPVSTQLTAAQTALGAELEKQTGSLFDKAAMDHLITASQQSVAAYEAAAQSADREIKTFSEQLLPLAQEKLRLAERMTGAGKSAAQLFRTRVPLPAGTGAAATPAAAPKQNAAPGASAKPGATPGTIPPPIASPAPGAVPKPIPPPIN